MCMHTASHDGMSHTMFCPAALMLVLGEAAQEAKKHPFWKLVRVVRSVSLLDNDCEAASPSGVMW